MAFFSLPLDCVYFYIKSIPPIIICNSIPHCHQKKFETTGGHHEASGPVNLASMRLGPNLNIPYKKELFSSQGQNNAGVRG